MKEKPTMDDLGRPVVYVPLHLQRDECEEGVIVDIGVGPYVFVRYGDETNAKATPFACLKFTDE